MQEIETKGEKKQQMYYAGQEFSDTYIKRNVLHRQIDKVLGRKIDDILWLAQTLRENNKLKPTEHQIIATARMSRVTPFIKLFSIQ